jgi:excisionase family DNA binding protein
MQPHATTQDKEVPMSIAITDPEFDVPGAARELELCDESVRRLIRRRQLRAMRIGRGYRIKRSWIREYIEGATTEVA